jgi:hypothetical protein
MRAVLSQSGIDIDDDLLSGSVDRFAVDARLQRLAVDGRDYRQAGSEDRAAADWPER